MISYLLSIVFVSLILVATALVGYSGVLFFAGLLFKGKHGKSAKIPFVSILVPAKNEEERLPSLLSQLEGQDYPQDRYEIIVTEDGSSDSTRSVSEQWVARFPKLIKLVTSTKSTGKPAALNRALAISKGEIIGVLDADSSVEKDLLQNVARNFEDGVVAIQGETSIRNRHHGLLTKLTSFEHEVWNRLVLRGRAKLGLFVPSLGNLTFIRRDVLNKVNGWDPSALAEDVELSVALYLKGYQFEYRPEVKCGEVTVSKVKSFYTQRIRWYGGYIQSFFRHGNLLKRLSAKSIDGEIMLSQPLTGVIGLCIFALGMIDIAAKINTSQIIAWTPYTIGAYTIFSLLATLSAFKLEGESHAWKLMPAIYLYWALSSVISFIAFLKVLTRRKIAWIRTEK